MISFTNDLDVNQALLQPGIFISLQLFHYNSRILNIHLKLVRSTVVAAVKVGVLKSRALRIAEFLVHVGLVICSILTVFIFNAFCGRVPS